MKHTDNNSFRDVLQYPKHFLHKLPLGCRVPVTYKNVWQDGFGARGWKLDVTINDPQIIASTRETGDKINTSVFVHDILDHFLSGFGVSGHRSEAMALIQLAKRTRSDIKADYEQMVKEDIFHGNVNGEALITFLPPQLVDLLPFDNEVSNTEIVTFLKSKVGEDILFDMLVEHFFTLGRKGEEHANYSWELLGLDSGKRNEIACTLQNLLEMIDSKVFNLKIEQLHGYIGISNNDVTFTMDQGVLLDSVAVYQAVVA